MAIGTSCYIRKIPEKELEALKSLGNEFSERTTTGIFLRLPLAYFKKKKAIEQQQIQISKLEKIIDAKNVEIEQLKEGVNQLFNSEKEMEKARLKLKELV